MKVRNRARKAIDRRVVGRNFLWYRSIRRLSDAEIIADVKLSIRTLSIQAGRVQVSKSGDKIHWTVTIDSTPRPEHYSGTSRIGDGGTTFYHLDVGQDKEDH